MFALCHCAQSFSRQGTKPFLIGFTRTQPAQGDFNMTFAKAIKLIDQAAMTVINALVVVGFPMLVVGLMVK
jgi:hypothetical protein